MIHDRGVAMALIEGIVIGGVGGTLAGISVYTIQFFHQKFKDHVESDRIYFWMEKTTEDKDGDRFRSTRAIASWNNLSEDRVRYLCSVDERIFLSTGKKEDLWSIFVSTRKGKSEEDS